MNNVIQRQFPGCFLVERKKTFLCFRPEKLHSAIILYHTIFNLKVLEDFADFVVKVDVK